MHLMYYLSIVCLFCPTSFVLFFNFAPEVMLLIYKPCRYDPQTNQWSAEVAPTSSCRTSVGVAVLDGYLYAVGGQDGVSCLNHVERYVSSYNLFYFKKSYFLLNFNILFWQVWPQRKQMDQSSIYDDTKTRCSRSRHQWLVSIILSHLLLEY